MAQEDIIFRASPAEILSGLHPSLPFDEAPLWQEGENVIFRDGGVRPAIGSVILFNRLESDPAVGGQEAIIGGNKYIFWGNRQSLFRWQEAGSPADISRVSSYSGIRDESASQRATLWSMLHWGDQILATNGVDPLQVSADPASAGIFADLDTTAVFTTAEIVAPVRDFVLALNLSIGGDVIGWADAGSLTGWAATAGGESGQLQIRGLGSDIVAAAALGDGLAIYGANRMHHASFVGSPNFIGERHLLDGIGAVSKHSVAAAGRLHYGFGPRGIWQTDGFQFKYIDQPDIHDFIFNDLNTNQISKAVSWNDQALDTVFFSYPRAGSLDNNRTIGFDYRTGIWSILSYGRSGALSQSIFAFAIHMTALGEILGQPDETAPIEQGGIPLKLTPLDANIVVGFGEGRFGQGGFGGKQTVAG